MLANWNIWLLLGGVLQGVLFCVMLLNRKSYRYGYGFLIAYMLALLAQLLFKIADKVWVMDHAGFAYAVSYHLPLLYGPLIWLFVKTVLRKQKRAMSGSLHFVPFLAAAIAESAFQNDVAPSWMFYVVRGWMPACFQVLSIGVYHFMALKYWRTYNNRLRSHFSAGHLIRLNWIRSMIISSLVVCSVTAVLIAFLYTTYPVYAYVRWGFLLLAAYMYWIGYCAMSQPQLFIAGLNKSFEEGSVPPSIPPLVVRKPAIKYASSHLSAAEASRIGTSVIELMEKNAMYLDPDLTIDVLAASAGTNRHLLSQVLNQRLGLSFYDFVNGYRIGEAKRLLLSPDHAHVKIASIAYDAGFNSLSAFNDVFRKTTGHTPSEFRKGQKTEDRSQDISQTAEGRRQKNSGTI